MQTIVTDTAVLDRSFTANDNVPIGHNVAQPSFLISFLVDARGGAMRGCRHSGVRIIIPPRKASQPVRVTCRYLRKDKLAHPPPLSEGEELASRILEMGPAVAKYLGTVILEDKLAHPPPLSEGEELASRILEMAPAGAKFLGPVILEVPHFASLRDREREIVILRSDDGQHWKEHQLEATEDAVQEVLNESFDAEELAQLDDLHTPRITRILTNDFPMYFAVVTRVRQEVHCVGPEGGVIMSSVVPRVQAIFPDGSLTKTIKVSVQAQPVPQEMVTRLHGNRVAVSPIVTVEPRRRKFHKPITLCIPLPQSSNKTRSKDDTEAATEGRIAFMTEPKIRSESLPPQQPICTLAISLPEYTGEPPTAIVQKDTTPFEVRYKGALEKELPEYVHQNVLKGVGSDWQRLARALELPYRDIQYIRQNYPGKEIHNVLKIWIHLKKEEASPEHLDNALRRIGRDDIVRSIAHGEPDSLSYGNGSDSPSSKRFEPAKHVELPAKIHRTFEIPESPERKEKPKPPVPPPRREAREVVQPARHEIHEVQHEEAFIEHPAKEGSAAGSAGIAYTAKLPTAAEVYEPVVAGPESQLVVRPEDEESVSEVRTVVRTERHVHDTENGPIVEERTITTTYEDDVAVNEHVVDRTVPLNEEEQQKWEELNRLAGHKAYIQEEEEPLPEGMAQEVETEKYTEPDGTVVTTTTITSHYTS
ncbi:ZU5 domain protein, partial [Oesophagostomum dentatum]